MPPSPKVHDQEVGEFEESIGIEATGPKAAAESKVNGVVDTEDADIELGQEIARKTGAQLKSDQVKA